MTLVYAEMFCNFCGRPVRKHWEIWYVCCLQSLEKSDLQIGLDKSLWLQIWLQFELNNSI